MCLRFITYIIIFLNKFLNIVASNVASLVGASLVGAALVGDAFIADAFIATFDVDDEASIAAAAEAASFDC